MSRMNNALVTLCAAACACMTTPSMAADPAPASLNYTVKPGDTLDKVIRQQLANSPLRVDILREALISQNPGAFAKGSPKILMAGAVLQLPDQEALMRKHWPATVSAPAATVSVADTVAADRSVAMRRQWVRYP
jgi:Tfp pilus assembly protein FimV